MDMSGLGEQQWCDFVQGGVASIGLDSVGDLRRPDEDIAQDLAKVDTGLNPKEWIRSLRDFANGMEIGDLMIAVSKGGDDLLGWGRITGEYHYNPDTSEHRVHTRTVKWHPCIQPIPLQPYWAYQVTKNLTRFAGDRQWVRLYQWLIDAQRSDPIPAGLQRPFHHHR